MPSFRRANANKVAKSINFDQDAKLKEVAMQLRDFDARAWVKETSIYVVWLLAFTLSIFATRSNVNQYNYVELFRSSMRSGISESFSLQSHFWQMLEKSAIPILGPAPTGSCGLFCIAGVLDASKCDDQGAYLIQELSPLFCPAMYTFAPSGLTQSCPTPLPVQSERACIQGSMPQNCSGASKLLGYTPEFCDPGHYGGPFGFDSAGCPNIPDSVNVTTAPCRVEYAFPSNEGDYGWSFVNEHREGNKTKDIFKSGENGNILVDGVWVRQLRVKSVNCSGFGRFSSPSLNCFPDWSSWSDVEEQVYSKTDSGILWANQGPEYVYMKADESMFPSKSGYHGGGYVFNFADPITATESLKQLMSNRWIDLKTRVIFTSVCVYNMNNNIFLCCNLMVEIDSLGKHQLKDHFFVVTLNQYDMKKASTLLKLGLQGVVGALVVYYLIEESKEMNQVGFKQYFTGSLWNTIDFLNLLLFMLSAYFQFQSIMNTSQMNADPTIISTARLLTTGDYTERNNIVIAINALLMWMKIFKYLSITKRLLRISTALKKVSTDVAAFLFVLGVVFAAFSVSGYLLLGNDVEDFSSLGNTFLKLYRVMLGDWDYSEFEGPAPLLGPAYFIMFVLATVIVLLNFMVGVLGEAYMSTIYDEEEAVKNGKSKIDVLDLLLHKSKERMGLPVDLNALAGLEQRLNDADEDGDGLVDLSELDKLLGGDSEAMFPGKSPQEILKMFDKDGNGNLDKSEILVSFSTCNSMKREAYLKRNIVSSHCELQDHTI
jgi:hypothetical protein